VEAKTLTTCQPRNDRPQISTQIVLFCKTEGLCQGVQLCVGVVGFLSGLLKIIFDLY